ncbi:MAG: hypothetical protein GY788_05215 [bacterium]|nr:hypothetical protein [bacterium]
MELWKRVCRYTTRIELPGVDPRQSPTAQPGATRFGRENAPRWLSTLWRDDDAFAEHRLRTVLIAVIVGVLAVAALAFGPEPGGKLATAWVTVSSTLLSLALITLIYELALRQSHAVALRRFIRLNSTVVRSGLQAIEEEADVVWRDLFATTSAVSFVLTSPYRAVGYLNDLIRAGRGRDIQIRFCLPDLPDQPAAQDPPPLVPQPEPATDSRSQLFARSIGADNRLASAIASTIQDLVSTFDRESVQLGQGAKLEIAVYETPVFTEGVILDHATVVMPIDSGGRPRGASATCMVFAEGQSREVIRLRQSLESVSEASVEVESKVATQP